jgi:hypothetical protein
MLLACCGMAVVCPGHRQDAVSECAVLQCSCVCVCVALVSLCAVWRKHTFQSARLAPPPGASRLHPFYTCKAVFMSLQVL